MNKIKTGSTFNVSLEILNNITRKPMIIDNNISIEAKIYSYKNELISAPLIETVNQDLYPGFVLLKVSDKDTKNWPVGEAYLNITLNINNNENILKTDTYKFIIEDDKNGY